MGKWEITTIDSINLYKGTSVNPPNTPNTVYELYSVPSWDYNYPEIVRGADIGSSKQRVQKGDVLICKINPRINRVWVVEKHTNNELIASSEWIVVRNSDINSRYLMRYFQSPQFRDLLISEQSGIGGSLTRAQPKQVKNYPVPLPPLPVQQKIAHILDSAYNLIEKRKMQMEKLDLLVKSRFIEMFGDPVTNPMGWEIKHLEDIATVGSSKRVFVEELVESGVPFYRGTEIGAMATGEKIVPTLFITKEHYDRLRDSTGVPAIGDFLMPSICPDGRIWRVNTTAPFYFKDGRVLWVHFAKKTNDDTYLLYALKEKIIADYDHIASGTTFTELKIFSLKSVSVLLPPLGLQHQFSVFVQHIESQKKQLKNSLALLELNYKSLIQKCFRGEVF